MLRKVLSLTLLFTSCCLASHQAQANNLCPSPATLVAQLSGYNHQSLIYVQDTLQGIPGFIQSIVDEAVNEFGAVSPNCINSPVLPPLKSCTFPNAGTLAQQAYLVDQNIQNRIADYKITHAEEDLESIAADAMFAYQNYEPCIVPLK